MDASEFKKNNEINTLIKELRDCLMPTSNIEDIFNLTFDVHRKGYTSNGQGGNISPDWDKVDETHRGALDNKCQYTPLKQELRAPMDVTMYALYCNGNVDVKSGDKITLKLDNKQDDLFFNVKAVRNPMMRYNYLVVLCAECQRYK